MKYKISTYVLSVLLAGMTIYACEKPSSTSVDSTSTDTKATAAAEQCNCYNKVSAQLVTKLNEEQGTSKLLRGTGALLNWNDAKPALDLYKEKFAVKCKEQGDQYVDIYGFAFGIEKFEDFANRVIAMDDPQGAKNLLGVRVYMGLKKRVIDNQEEFFHDVFLVPIGKDGNNIYSGLDDCTKPPKHDKEDDGTVLNTSMLCPNRCE